MVRTDPTTRFRVAVIGKAATSSGESGKLAADFVRTGAWRDDLSADVFRVHLAE